MTRAQSSSPITWMLLFGAAALVAAALAIGDLPSLFDGATTKDDSGEGPAVEVDHSAPEIQTGGTAGGPAPGDQPGAAGEGGEIGHDREAVRQTFLTAVVQGSVQTAAGEPIDGAAVRLESCLPEFLRDILAGGRYEAEAQSGPDGAFAIRAPCDGAFRLTAAKEGFAAFFADLVLPGDDLAIILSSGAILRGEVRDSETAAPVTGALVRARRGFTVRESATKPDGSFEITDLSEGLHSIEVYHAGYDVERADGIRVEREAGGRADIELRPGAPLAGRVLALDTRLPIAGAQIVYRIWSWEPHERREILAQTATTDREGRFEFECVSRRGYRIEALADGFSPGVPEPGARPGEPGAELEFYLKRVAAVAGRVLDPLGRAVEDAQVRVMEPDPAGGAAPSARTGKDGCFHLRDVEGDAVFSLIAVHPEHGPGVAGKLVVGVGGSLDNVEIVLTRPGEIRGRVIGPEGEPVAGAQVTIDGHREYLMRYGGAAPMGVTGENGRFAFAGLPSGDYRIAACAGALRSETLSLFLQEGEVYDSALEVKNGLALNGRVMDCEGAPLDDVLVTAVAFSLEPPAAEGAPRKAPVAPRSEGRGEKPGKGRAPDPEPRSGAASKKGALETRVKGALDDRPWRIEPVEFDIMRRVGLSRFRGNARTNECGEFVLPGLDPGDVLFLIFRRYGYAAEVLAEVPAATPLVEMVLFPEVGLAGRVVDDAAGAPIPRFRVEWAAVGGDGRETEEILRAPQSWSGSSFESPDGSFYLERLEPGEILLRATAKGYRAGEPQRFIVPARYGAPYQVLRLERGGVIQGRVTAGNGTAVAHVPVFLEKTDAGRVKGHAQRKGGQRSKRGLLLQRTDEEGRFTFSDLDEGTYELSVADADEPPAGPATIKLGAGRSVSRSFLLQELGTLEVRVRGESGVSCRASLELAGGPAKVDIRRTTGNLGTASFSNLLPGKYKVKIQAEGYMPAFETLSIEDGKEIRIEIELKRRN